MPNFTTEDLLMFLYNELPAGKKQQIEEALHHNWSLREKLQVLKEAAQRLSGCSLKSPRNKSINALLNYAATKFNVSSS